MKIDVILRTHDNKNVHLIGSRIVDATKQEIVLRCARSLAVAVTEARKEHQINVVVIDDHSQGDTVAELKAIFPDAIFENLELTGNNASMIRWYDYAKKSEADVVYLVEDDYLHDPIAIREMADTWQKFSKSSEKRVALFPTDDPDNHRTRFVEQCTIYPGKRILWRTNTYTTGTMWLPPSIIRDRWEVIDNFARKYGLVEGLSEDTVYRPIWTSDVNLYTPLYPLAYHLNEWKHPIFDHKNLWKKYKK